MTQSITLPPPRHPVDRRTPRPVHGVARLTISINGVPYNARPIPSPDGSAWTLRKADGNRYVVAETPHGPTCDCGDFTWRREGRDPRGCKHVLALAAVGLLPAGKGGGR